MPGPSDSRLRGNDEFGGRMNQTNLRWDSIEALGELNGKEVVGEVADAFLYTGYGLSGGLASAVEIVSQLGLVNAGDAFEAGQTEGFHVFLKKTGRVIEELVVNLFKRLVVTLIIQPDIIVGLSEVFDGLFHGFTLTVTTIIKPCFFHIC